MAAGEDQAAVARKLDDGLKVLGLGSAQNLGLLLNLLGLKTPEGSLQSLDGVLIGFRTRDLLRRLLRARCQMSRGIVAIEDLHWIDSASEELLGEIVTSAESVPLMIVHTRRPEYRPPWSEQPNVSHVPLEPLSAGETARIVEARFGGDNLPEELRRIVAAKAEGNALFAEELVSFLLERGFVRRESGGIVFDAVTVASALPASVQSLLTARVDRLASADRALLQAAAVIGRRFDPDLLAVVTSASGDIDRSLAAMQALDLVHRESKTGDYIFKHALVRDAVYSSLLSTARSMLHLKIADEIERRAPIVFPKSRRHSRTTTRPLRAPTRLSSTWRWPPRNAWISILWTRRMPMPGRRWTCSNRTRSAPTIWPSLTSWRTTFTSFTRNPHSSKSSALHNATCRSLRQWAIPLSLSSPCTFTHSDWQVAMNSVRAKPCHAERWRWRNA